MENDLLSVSPTGRETSEELLEKGRSLYEQAASARLNGRGEEADALKLASEFAFRLAVQTRKCGALEQENAELKEQCAKVQEKVLQVQRQLIEMVAAQYNSRAERGASLFIHPGQLGFDLSGMGIPAIHVPPAENEEPAEETENPDVSSAGLPKRRKKTKKKSLTEMMAALSVLETVWHDDEFDPPVCPECGSLMDILGHHRTVELMIKPAVVGLREHFDPTFGCRNCEKNGTNVPIVRPEMSLIRPLPRSAVSAEMLAYLIYMKVLQALPLYRMERMLANLGTPISRMTMSNWMIEAAFQWLAPLAECMRRELVKQDIIHADETPYHVLNEPGRKTTQKGYVWIYCSPYGAAVRYVLLDYRASHAAACPKEFLAGFHRTLMTDGYSAYPKLADMVEFLVLTGCWAHDRREWYKAVKASGTDSVAAVGFTYVEKLFALEAVFEDLSPEDRFFARLNEEKPLLDEFHAWLMEQYDGQTPLGKAVTYTVNQWPRLYMILSDGRLPATNAAAEIIAKNFAVGRKNFLFSTGLRGAHALMNAYSVIETARANDINVLAYLTWIFGKLPKTWKWVEAQLAPAISQIDVLAENALDEWMPLAENALHLPEQAGFSVSEALALIRPELKEKMFRPACREMEERLAAEAKLVAARDYLPIHAPPDFKVSPPEPRQRKHSRNQKTAAAGPVS